ncbi:13862_t:CDS:2 [Rhizophagus irregularis]|nr:13862_t:CDS:2 [Rhizophagus irregularis]
MPVSNLNVARRGGTRSGRGNNIYFVSLIDVHENDKEFLVNAELPDGLNKDQINIDVRDNVLIISAEDITAKFENGLLELKLPKSAPTGRKITIE